MTTHTTPSLHRTLCRLALGAAAACTLLLLGLPAARADWSLYPTKIYLQPKPPRGWTSATLQNNLAASAFTNDCADPRILKPAPGEYGHYAAVRLTPSRAPFVVLSVSYDLVDEAGQGCNASLAHEVLIWVEDDLFPSPDPVILDVLNVPAKTRPNETVTTVTVPLPTSLRVEKGEHLFVAVRMAGGANNMVCLTFCGGRPITPGANYWSNATAEPFPWQTLESFSSYFSDVRVKAHGWQSLFFYP